MKNDKNKGKQLIRSSAAEYLTFVAASGKGGVEAVYADENIWLTQKMLGVLYDVETNTINYHLKKVFSDSELQEDSVIRNFRITAADGKNYNAKHYNLSAIIAVGYKVNSSLRSKRSENEGCHGVVARRSRATLRHVSYTFRTTPWQAR